MIRDSMSKQYILMNEQIQTLGPTQAMGSESPSHQWETGRIVHNHKAHPQCRVSLISELLLTSPQFQLLTHHELCWFSACRVWPASHHGLGPAISGSTHFSMCAHVCYLTTHRLHQRHPRGIPSSGPGETTCLPVNKFKNEGNMVIKGHTGSFKTI